MTRLSSHHMYYLDSKIINVRLHTFFYEQQQLRLHCYCFRQFQIWKVGNPQGCKYELVISSSYSKIKRKSIAPLYLMPYTVLSGKFL